MLHIAVAVASGSDLFGVNGWLMGQSPGHVVYVALEDPAIEIHRRLKSILAREAIPDTVLSDIDIYSVRLASRLMTRDGYQIAISRDAWTDLAQISQGARLVIIEPLIQTHDLDENHNADMARLMDEFNRLAAAANTAILIGHHQSKINEGGSGAARGASAIVDNARWAAELQVPDAKTAQKLGLEPTHDPSRYAVLGTSKTNYGPPARSLLLHREDGGALSLVQNLSAKSISTTPTATAKHNVVPLGRRIIGGLGSVSAGEEDHTYESITHANEIPDWLR